MKTLLTLFGLLFSLTSGAVYFPLGLTPETLQAGRAGVNTTTDRGVWNAELSLHGEKKDFIRSLFGDALKWNHNFSAGILGDTILQQTLYGAFYVYFDNGSIGTGAKQVIFHDIALKGELKGELTYFAYYYFVDKNIIFGEGKEFLSFYVGFKSDFFNFEKEQLISYLNKAKDLAKLSENIVFGFYYDWDVTGKISAGFETNFESYVLSTYFKIF